jgi:cell division protease FtsH
LNNNLFAKAAIWLVIALVLFTVFKQFEGRQRPGEAYLPYSEFLAEVNSGRVRTVTIQDSTVTPEVVAETVDGRRIRTVATVLDRGLMGDLI